VVFGNVIHTEAADAYMARVVGVKAGVPKEVPAYTVNRLCGTGVQAIVSAAQAIQTGEARVALASGAESMSRGPYWLPKARWGARMGDVEPVDAVTATLTDPFESILMG
jgi:acetyl-CoA C-acetyltransferase